MMAMNGISAVNGRMENIERSLVSLDGTMGLLNEKVGRIVGRQGGGPVRTGQAIVTPVESVEPKKRESPNEVSIRPDFMDDITELLLETYQIAVRHVPWMS